MFGITFQRSKITLKFKQEWGVRQLTGEYLEVVWAEFSTLSWAVLLIIPKLCRMQMATSKVENSAQVSSCKLKFVHDMKIGFKGHWVR